MVLTYIERHQRLDAVGLATVFTPWLHPRTGTPPSRTYPVFIGLPSLDGPNREYNGCANMVTARTDETGVAEHVDSVRNSGKFDLARCMMEMADS